MASSTAARSTMGHQDDRLGHSRPRADDADENIDDAPKFTKRFNFEQGNPGAAAGESARAQTFLLQEAMRPGVPLAFERRNGVGVVINVQVVTGSVIDRIDHALEIKRDVLIFGPQRYREGWQPLV